MTPLVTPTLDHALRLGDRMSIPAPGPARIVQEVPIAIPREARADAEIAAIKAGLARRIQGEQGDEPAGRDVS
jgi:NitT/TauT family transport system ATP-binding protein